MRKTLLLVALLTATDLAASARDARLAPNCEVDSHGKALFWEWCY